MSAPLVGLSRVSIGRRVRQWQLSYIDNDQRQERHQRDASLSVRRPAAIGQRRSLRSTHETVPVGEKKKNIYLLALLQMAKTKAF